MPADITAIFAAVKTLLAAADADVPIRTSKRPAAEGKQLEGGHSLGYPTTCYVISCSDPEPIDGAGDFENVSVGYKVCVEFIKSAQAKVDDAVDTGHPPTVVEDPEIRDKRALLRATLYKNTLTGTRVFHCTHTTRPVYERLGSGGAVSLVSGEEFAYLTLETRP